MTPSKIPQTPPEAAPGLAWRPTWGWHLKALGVIYALLAVGFVLADRFLSRLPAPYAPRDIPQEMTPWLKK